MPNIGKYLHVELFLILCQYLNCPASLRRLEEFICTGH
jgi:hypothetical protein